MSLELRTQSQNHVVRSLVSHRSCHKAPLAAVASRSDLFALADIVELQIAVVAARGCHSAFCNDVDPHRTASPGRLYV